MAHVTHSDSPPVPGGDVPIATEDDLADGMLSHDDDDDFPLIEHDSVSEDDSDDEDDSEMIYLGLRRTEVMSSFSGISNPIRLFWDSFTHL